MTRPKLLSETCVRCGRKIHPNACRDVTPRKPTLRAISSFTQSRRLVVRLRDDRLTDAARALILKAALDAAEAKGQDFGFGLALAECQKAHDSPSIYSEAVNGYGYTIEMAKASGLEEFDLRSLRKIFKESKK